MDAEVEDIVEMRDRLDALTAKDEIRGVLTRYARATDRGDVAYFLLGADQLGQLRDYRHYITNTTIELDEDRAFVESSFLCTLELPLTGGGYADGQAEGRYFDVFLCREGEWKIWRRLMQSEKYIWRLREAQPFASDGRPEGIHSKWPDDPVYQRYAVPKLIPPPFRVEGNPWEYLRHALDDLAKDCR